MQGVTSTSEANEYRWCDRIPFIGALTYASRSYQNSNFEAEREHIRRLHDEVLPWHIGYSVLIPVLAGLAIANADKIKAIIGSLEKMLNSLI